MTFPVLQCALVIARLAAASSFPLTLGTTQRIGGGVSLRWKVAITKRWALIVTVQVPLPEHAPPQPAKVEVEAGVAVSVTGVPSTKTCAQVGPQLIPAGAERIEPEPVPTFETVSVLYAGGGGGFASKRAVTERLASVVSVQAPVPEQAPDQPANLDPAAGVAVSLTTVPKAKLWAQVAPHEIPGGLEVTEPEPEPVLDTLSVMFAAPSHR